MNDTVMAAEDPSAEIDNIPGRGGSRPQPLDHACIMAARDEADVLTVLFIGDRQPEPPGEFTGFHFGPIAEWKTQNIELRARRGKQEIALVAFRLTRAIE